MGDIINSNDETKDSDQNKCNKNVSSTSELSCEYLKYVSYDGDICIYTEPKTNRQLIWDVDQNAWVPRDFDETTSNKPEFDGESYIFTDKTTSLKYKFDPEKSEWIVIENDENKVGVSHNGTSVLKVSGGGVGIEDNTDASTYLLGGPSYFWDPLQHAWFPKVDDEFMARYQMSYGIVDSNNVSTLNAESNTENKMRVEKEECTIAATKKVSDQPSWFEIDEDHNTSIYIAGLPLDITIDELFGIVSKYGILARDDKNKDKIKLYVDSDGQPKGDALCTFLKVESVTLALSLMDGLRLRSKTISVERAKFAMKGQYDPSLKPKRKKNYKDRQKKLQEKLFGWLPETLPRNPSKNERVVIIKNLFTPKDFDEDVQLLLEYQQDIRSECMKCGEVTNVTIHDRHPDGIAQVKFREPTGALECIKLLNGRWFGKREISAEIWDGKTKYKIPETNAETETRKFKWGKHLENDQ